MENKFLQYRYYSDKWRKYLYDNKNMYYHWIDWMSFLHAFFRYYIYNQYLRSANLKIRDIVIKITKNYSLYTSRPL